MFAQVIGKGWIAPAQIHLPSSLMGSNRACQPKNADNLIIFARLIIRGRNILFQFPGPFHKLKHREGYASPKTGAGASLTLPARKNRRDSL